MPLHQKLTNVFCNGADSKYRSFVGPLISVQLLRLPCIEKQSHTTQKWTGVAADHGGFYLNPEILGN